MKKQVFNPYLPLHEYIPDGEPHVFGDRLYVYGSHDQERGEGFCLLDYVCYSAPVDDLSDWTYEGVIYEKTQDPSNVDGKCQLFAPDACQGPDGRYYLYYALNGKGVMSVAVCDTPAGKFQYHGTVSYSDGRPLRENWPFDPAVIHDEGQVYLYYGFAPTNLEPSWTEGKDVKGCSVVKLDQDMITVLEGPTPVLPSQQYSKGTTFEGHEYFEAPSIRKVGSVYYLVYSSILFHELCYASSDYPDRDFVYGGPIVSNGDVGIKGRTEADKVNYTGNNHGGLVQVIDQWYIFYHRHTHGTQYSRQGCAEPVTIEADGSIQQVEITSCGLNQGPLAIGQAFPATICCHLTCDEKRQTFPSGKPYITSKEDQRFITHISEGATIGYKYFQTPDQEMVLGITYRGEGNGHMEVAYGLEDTCVKSIPIQASNEWTTIKTTLPVMDKAFPLYFTYTGKGRIDLLEFQLA